MQIFLLKRVDGGVEIMRLLKYTPEEAIAKWSPERQAELTGEIFLIQESDIPTDRSEREAWTWQ